MHICMRSFTQKNTRDINFSSVCLHKHKNRPSKKKEIKIINRERKFLIYAHNNHSVMGILTLHSQNRLGRRIFDACMQREKFLPYFYVKILHQKNVITFFLNGI